MIEAKVQELLNRVLDNDPITLVLQWRRMPDDNRLAEISSMAERKLILERHFQSAKLPTLDWLYEHREVQVNDVEGTGNTIVTATARAWRVMIQEPGSPLWGRDIIVCPNVEFYTT